MDKLQEIQDALFFSSFQETLPLFLRNHGASICYACGECSFSLGCSCHNEGQKELLAYVAP